MRRPALLLATVALLVIGAGLLAFSGCGDGGGDEATPTSPPAPTATSAGPGDDQDTPPASTTPASAIRIEATRGPVEGAGSGPGPATLVDVRTEALDGADRIIFEFIGGRPSYFLSYSEPPITSCGSGEPQDVLGNAYLVARFIGTNAHDEAGAATIEATELLPALPSLVEAQLICDFEADVQWALGLEQEADFSVVEQENPYALILEFSHP